MAAESPHEELRRKLQQEFEELDLNWEILEKKLQEFLENIEKGVLFDSPENQHEVAIIRGIQRGIEQWKHGRGVHVFNLSNIKTLDVDGLRGAKLSISRDISTGQNNLRYLISDLNNIRNRLSKKGLSPEELYKDKILSGNTLIHEARKLGIAVPVLDAAAAPKRGADAVSAGPGPGPVVFPAAATPPVQTTQSLQNAVATPASNEMENRLQLDEDDYNKISPEQVKEVAQKRVEELDLNFEIMEEHLNKLIKASKMVAIPPTDLNAIKGIQNNIKKWHEMKRQLVLVNPSKDNLKRIFQTTAMYRNVLDSSVIPDLNKLYENFNRNNPPKVQRLTGKALIAEARNWTGREVKRASEGREEVKRASDNRTVQLVSDQPAPAPAAAAAAPVIRPETNLGAAVAATPPKTEGPGPGPGPVAAAAPASPAAAPAREVPPRPVAAQPAKPATDLDVVKQFFYTLLKRQFQWEAVRSKSGAIKNINIQMKYQDAINIKKILLDDFQIPNDCVSVTKNQKSVATISIDIEKLKQTNIWKNNVGPQYALSEAQKILDNLEYLIFERTKSYIDSQSFTNYMKDKEINMEKFRQDFKKFKEKPEDYINEATSLYERLNEQLGMFEFAIPDPTPPAQAAAPPVAASQTARAEAVRILSRDSAVRAAQPAPAAPAPTRAAPAAAVPTQEVTFAIILSQIEAMRRNQKLTEEDRKTISGVYKNIKDNMISGIDYRSIKIKNYKSPPFVEDPVRNAVILNTWVMSELQSVLRQCDAQVEAQKKQQTPRRQAQSAAGVATAAPADRATQPGPAAVAPAAAASPAQPMHGPGVFLREPSIDEKQQSELLNIKINFCVQHIEEIIHNLENEKIETIKRKFPRAAAYIKGQIKKALVVIIGEDNITFQMNTDILNRLKSEVEVYGGLDDQDIASIFEEISKNLANTFASVQQSGVNSLTITTNDFENVFKDYTETLFKQDLYLKFAEMVTGRSGEIVNGQFLKLYIREEREKIIEKLKSTYNIDVSKFKGKNVDGVFEYEIPIHQIQSALIQPSVFEMVSEEFAQAQDATPEANFFNQQFKNNFDWKRTFKKAYGIPYGPVREIESNYLDINVAKKLKALLNIEHSDIANYVEVKVDPNDHSKAKFIIKMVMIRREKLLPQLRAADRSAIPSGARVAARDAVARAAEAPAAVAPAPTRAAPAAAAAVSIPAAQAAPAAEPAPAPAAAPARKQAAPAAAVPTSELSFSTIVARMKNIADDDRIQLPPGKREKLLEFYNNIIKNMKSYPGINYNIIKIMNYKSPRFGTDEKQNAIKLDAWIKDQLFPVLGQVEAQIAAMEKQQASQGQAQPAAAAAASPAQPAGVATPAPAARAAQPTPAAAAAAPAAGASAGVADSNKIDELIRNLTVLEGKIRASVKLDPNFKKLIKMRHKNARINEIRTLIINLTNDPTHKVSIDRAKETYADLQGILQSYNAEIARKNKGVLRGNISAGARAAAPDSEPRAAQPASAAAAGPAQPERAAAPAAGAVPRAAQPAPAAAAAIASPLAPAANYTVDNFTDKLRELINENERINDGKFEDEILRILSEVYTTFRQNRDDSAGLTSDALKNLIIPAPTTTLDYDLFKNHPHEWNRQIDGIILPSISSRFQHQPTPSAEAARVASTAPSGFLAAGTPRVPAPAPQPVSPAPGVVSPVAVPKVPPLGPEVGRAAAERKRGRELSENVEAAQAISNLESLLEQIKPYQDSPFFKDYFEKQTIKDPKARLEHYISQLKANLVDFIPSAKKLYTELNKNLIRFEIQHKEDIAAYVSPELGVAEVIPDKFDVLFDRIINMQDELLKRIPYMVTYTKEELQERFRVNEIYDKGDDLIKSYTQWLEESEKYLKTFPPFKKSDRALLENEKKLDREIVGFGKTMQLLNKRQNYLLYEYEDLDNASPTIENLKIVLSQQEKTLTDTYEKIQGEKERFWKIRAPFTYTNTINNLKTMRSTLAENQANINKLEIELAKFKFTNNKETINKMYDHLEPVEITDEIEQLYKKYKSLEKELEDNLGLGGMFSRWKFNRRSDSEIAKILDRYRELEKTLLQLGNAIVAKKSDLSDLHENIKVSDSTKNSLLDEVDRSLAASAAEAADADEAEAEADEASEPDAEAAEEQEVETASDEWDDGRDFELEGKRHAEDSPRSGPQLFTGGDFQQRLGQVGGAYDRNRESGPDGVDDAPRVTPQRQGAVHRQREVDSREELLRISNPITQEQFEQHAVASFENLKDLIVNEPEYVGSTLQRGSTAADFTLTIPDEENNRADTLSRKIKHGKLNADLTIPPSDKALFLMLESMRGLNPTLKQFSKPRLPNEPHDEEAEKILIRLLQASLISGIKVNFAEEDQKILEDNEVYQYMKDNDCLGNNDTEYGDNFRGLIEKENEDNEDNGKPPYKLGDDFSEMEKMLRMSSEPRRPSTP